MKVHLLIGVTSFVGRHLASYLLERRQRVFGTYCRTERVRLVDRRVRLLRCDVTRRGDLERAVRRARPDAVYYLSAQSNVRGAWREPVRTLEVNMVAGVRLFEILRAVRPEARMVVFSSGTVYGLSHLSGRPLREGAPLAPKDPYGLSKAGLDFMGRFYGGLLGLNAVVLRLANLIGPGQSPVFSLSNFAYQIAGMEAGCLPKVMQVGSLEAKRDYLDIRDAARAIYLAAVKGKRGEVYNIGSGTAKQLGDVLDQVIRLSRVRRRDIVIRKNAALISKNEIPAMRLNGAKFKRLTGWRPCIPFRESLRVILDDWRRYWNEN